MSIYRQLISFHLSSLDSSSVYPACYCSGIWQGCMQLWSWSGVARWWSGSSPTPHRLGTTLSSANVVQREVQPPASLLLLSSPHLFGEIVLALGRCLVCSFPSLTLLPVCTLSAMQILQLCCFFFLSWFFCSLYIMFFLHTVNTFSTV